MKDKTKKIIYLTIIISIIAIIVLITAMVIEINKMYDEYKQQISSVQYNDNEETNINDNYEEASSNVGKTIEEVKNESTEENKNTNTEKTTNKEKEEKEKKEDTQKEKNKTAEETVENKKEEVIPDPVFVKPVDGEIIKEYSKENLVYSETLKEWTTHTGIDIEAEMSSVVKSAEEGTVEAIKNDPRYGITVIISHVNGYETRYSNLLTAEFVSIGEKVTKGQTIGTVGNTASFEVADKAHLHFEILKNSEYLDPSQIIK